LTLTLTLTLTPPLALALAQTLTLTLALILRLNPTGPNLPALCPTQWADDTSVEALRRDQRIQFDAMRSGNAMGQNEILGQELGKG